MNENEKAFCQQRPKTLYPEVERARAAVRAAEEVRGAAKGALDRERENMKLEMEQVSQVRAMACPRTQEGKEGNPGRGREGPKVRRRLL